VPKERSCSSVCHFDPGETPKERHQRRLRLAVENMETVAAWCAWRGVEFQAKGGKNNWQFRVVAKRKVASWIPSLGRFWSLRDWLKDGPTYARCHDWLVLLKMLEAWLS